MNEFNEEGYPLFEVNGKMQLAHEVSFILYNGEYPKGLNVFQKCENKACVNPAHLTLVTPVDLDIMNLQIRKIGKTWFSQSNGLGTVFANVFEL